VIATLLVIVQVVVATALTPLLIGVMRQMRARMEGRVGAGLLQPYRDVRKLLAKEPMRADGSSVILVAAPLVLLISSLMVVALVPLVTTATIPSVPNDLFVVVSILLIGTVSLALLGLDTGTAFGGMGSSRHMMIAALVEPTVLMSVYALSIPVGSSTLSKIVVERGVDVTRVVTPAGLLAVVALVVVVLAETGRLPVDNPSTHLELTMIHESMILESAGRDLAWLEVGSWLRLTALLGLVVNLALPWGLASNAQPLGLLVAIVALGAKLLVAGGLIAGAEVFMAKLRLFKVPELLAGSFVLAFLAVTASYLAG
jgi:formate hydrogenlyase subunit 4